MPILRGVLWTDTLDDRSHGLTSVLAVLAREEQDSHWQSSLLRRGTSIFIFIFSSSKSQKHFSHTCRNPRVTGLRTIPIPLRLSRGMFSVVVGCWSQAVCIQ